MEKWFSQQSYLSQLILLVIPVIGWIVEVLVRAFAVIRNHNKPNIIGLIIFTIFGLLWLPCIIDAIVLLKREDLMLIE